MKKVLYLRGFPPTFTKSDLSAVFRPLGRLKKVEIISNDEKLFGIIKFLDDKNVEKAIESHHMKEVDGIKWYAALCNDSKDHNQVYERNQEKKKIREKTIFLRDFSETFNEEAVVKMFSVFGEISEIKFKQPAAFVTFVNSESVEKVLKRKKFLFFEGKRIFINRMRIKKQLGDLIRLKKARKEERVLKNKKMINEGNNN
jgi:RNA recognition motif-containing protein